MSDFVCLNFSAIIGQQTTGFGQNPLQGIQSNPQMIMKTTNGVTTMTMIFDNGDTMTMQVPANSQGTGPQQILSQVILPDGTVSQVLPSQQTITISKNNNGEEVSINR